MPVAVAVVGDEVLVGIHVRAELLNRSQELAFVRRILFDRFEIVLEVFNPLEGSVHISVPFKDFVSAQITLAGVELLRRIRQGQFALRKLGVAEKTASDIWNAVLAA
jgi:hypothetical protein